MTLFLRSHDQNRTASDSNFQRQFYRSTGFDRSHKMQSGLQEFFYLHFDKKNASKFVNYCPFTLVNKRGKSHIFHCTEQQCKCKKHFKVLPTVKALQQNKLFKHDYIMPTNFDMCLIWKILLLHGFTQVNKLELI